MSAVAAPGEPRVTPVRGPVRVARSERLALAALSAVAIAVLGVAFALEPDSRGYGTHERLGLPPCGLMRMTGVPCPSCGLTTSFAHAVRLDLAGAAKAQPLGLILTLLTALVAAFGPIAALLGTPVLSRLPVTITRRAGVAFIAAIVVCWIYKIFATFLGGHS